MIDLERQVPPAVNFLHHHLAHSFLHDPLHDSRFPQILSPDAYSHLHVASRLILIRQAFSRGSTWGCAVYSLGGAGFSTVSSKLTWSRMARQARPAQMSK